MENLQAMSEADPPAGGEAPPLAPASDADSQRDVEADVGDTITLPPDAEILLTQLEKADVADRCRQSGRMILQAEMRTSAGRIDSGRELVARKAELPHGKFKPYCESLGVETRLAQRCMKVFKSVGHEPKAASKLSFDLLCDLSDKAVPQLVRDEVIGRLKAGEHLAPTVVRQMIGKVTKPRARPGAVKGGGKGPTKAGAEIPQDDGKSATGTGEEGSQVKGEGAAGPGKADPKQDGKNATGASRQTSQDDGNISAQAGEAPSQEDGEGGVASSENVAQNNEVDAGENGRATSQGTPKETTGSGEGTSQKFDPRPSEACRGLQSDASESRALARSAARVDSIGRSDAEYAIEIISELGPEKMLELGQVLEGVDETEFMKLLRQRCTAEE